MSSLTTNEYLQHFTSFREDCEKHLNKLRSGNIPRFLLNNYKSGAFEFFNELNSHTESIIKLLEIFREAPKSLSKQDKQEWLSQVVFCYKELQE